MRLTRAVPAGLVDAACASLATFVVGLYATLALSPAGLGVYALFFTAFLSAAVVPAHLLFTPAEIAALQSPPGRRLRLAEETLLRGLACALLAGAVAAAFATVAAPPAADAPIVPLVLASIATSVISPLQDHVRRTAHLGHRSWTAAGISLVQLVAVSAALAVLSRLATSAWVPFAALATANVFSVTVGVVWTRMQSTGRADRLGTRQLLSAGRWLLPLALFPAVALFVSGVLVTHFAGAEAFGYVEAARVLAQPIVVFGLGMMAVLSPRLMEAGRAGAAGRGAVLARGYEVAVAAAVVAYLLVAGVDWAGSPLPELVPPAYVVPGLLALTIVGHGASMLMQPYHAELLGAGRERDLLLPEGAGSALLCLVAVAAIAVGGYARPAGVIVQGLVTWWWLRRLRRRAVDRGGDVRSRPPSVAQPPGSDGPPGPAGR
ncbi:MAG TPA: hypothetical protein VM307_02755 [Egibacteraceae bacterium]|nr:hypothetical protein [Egibacteraceae bacterium]